MAKLSKLYRASYPVLELDPKNGEPIVEFVDTPDLG